MLRFAARRLLISIPIVILASFLTFLLVINAGTPAPIQNLQAKPGHSEAAVEALRDQYGLNESWYQRYWSWATSAAHGDFGNDNQGRPVWESVQRSLFVTLRLVIVAEFLALVLGVAVGVMSAVRQYSFFDHFSTGAAFLFFAMPVFWFAVLLKEYGAIRLNDALEPLGISHAIKTIGYQTPGVTGLAVISDAIGYAILPVLTLTVVSFAVFSRFQRASMLETMSSDYVRTARAKGISERRVIFRHALRNALIPVTTLLAVDFGVLLGGAIITEHVFGWPGMGTLFLNSVTQVDPNVLLCWLLVVAIIVVVFNLIADILYAYLDPRIRIG